MKIQIVKKATNSKKQSNACDWMVDEPPMRKQ
jgi:hypothetical protein